VSSLSVVSIRTPDLVLANPTAGGGLAQGALPRLRTFASEQRWSVEFRSAASSAEFAQRACEEVAAGRERIFALGGDGTFQVLLNAVAGNPQVSIGVLPAGGGNDLASALGLPHDVVQAAEALLLRGEVSCLDAARVRTSDGVERLYMGGGGVGLDAEAARFASGVYRKIRGRGRYLLSAVRALWRFQPMDTRIVLEDSTEKLLETKALVVAVLNTPSYGAGVRLAPDASLQDGKLDLVIVEDLNALEIVRALAQLAASGEIHSKHVQRRSIQRARIETDIPCVFHADGEIIGRTPVEIGVVRRAMRVWHLPWKDKQTSVPHGKFSLRNQ
jgi:diacylglycerol kinase (ATP)